MMELGEKVTVPAAAQHGCAIASSEADAPAPGTRGAGNSNSQQPNT